jgi:hypothetical protein
MLLAKISPAASFTSQSGPFTASETITADYLTALARPYIAGAAQTNFEVIFGTYTAAVAGVEASEGVEAVEAQPAKFNHIQSSSVTLTAEELAAWGTDDSVLLTAVASKLGTSVISTVTVDSSRLF